MTQADDTQLDLETVLNRSSGAPPPRYAGRVPDGSTPIWRHEDDRPRWLRRLDEQRPERPRARRSAVPADDESMPWLAGVSWPDADGGRGGGGDERN